MSSRGGLRDRRSLTEPEDLRDPSNRHRDCLVAGPSLRREKSINRLRLERIGREAVRRIRRIHDQAARLQDLAEAVERVRIEQVLRPERLREDRRRHVAAQPRDP